MNEKPGFTSDPESPPGSHPYSQEPRLGVLNLILGGTAFAVASAMAGAALTMSGSQTLVGAIAALITAVAFLILWNLRIHRQPHGFFLCASLLCLGGAAVCLGHALYIGEHGRPTQAKGGGDEPQVFTGTPRTTWQQPRSSEKSKPVSAAKPAPKGPATAPGPEAEPEPAAAPKSPEWTAAWGAAQAEAMRRYPALGIRDSRENKTFVAAYQSLRRANPTYFDDPEWPLTLAQALAERDGWERGDGIIEDRPMESLPALPDTRDSGSEVR